MTTETSKQGESLFDRAIEEKIDGADLNLNLDLDLKNDVLATEDLENISSSNEEVTGDSSSSSDNSSEESSDSDKADVDEDDADIDDDDDIDGDGPTSTGPIRSKHEIVDEPIVEVPKDFRVTPEMRISEIGVIKSVFENNIIIRASASGEQRVLEEGAIFCLEDRTILGTLSEVFGPVRDPFYRVSLPAGKSDLSELATNSIGSKVYVVMSEAHWIDTFELKLTKGTDASNGFDEELPEDEQEFSDDEKEAQFKKMKRDKAKKKKKNNNNNNNNNNTTNGDDPNVSNRNAKSAPRIGGTKQENVNTGRTPHYSYKSRKSRQLTDTNNRPNVDDDDSGDDSYDPFGSNGFQQLQSVQGPGGNQQYGNLYNFSYPPQQQPGIQNAQNRPGMPYVYPPGPYTATPIHPTQFQSGAPPQPFYGFPGQYPMTSPSGQPQYQNYYPQVQNQYNQNQVYEMHQMLFQQQQQQQQQQRHNDTQDYSYDNKLPPY